MAFARTIVSGSMLNGIKVEAMMNQESLVLTCHYGNGEMRRNIIERHPMMAHLYGFTVSRLLEAAYHHKRCYVYRYKPVGHNSKYC